MASGSERFISYAKETIEKTAPAGVYKKIRNTGGAGIANERTSVTSNEIRNDRMIITSRLGQNQPNVTIPYEFSYETLDEFFEGALGNSWVGDYELLETVSFGDATNTITLDDGSNWQEKGLSVGDFIAVRNSDSNDGVYVVKAFVDSAGTSDQITVYEADGMTDATLVLTAADEINVEGGAFGGSVDTSLNTLTISSVNKTITAATAVFGDISIGDAVYFSGFSTGGNNGYKRVTAATPTVLTFADDTFINETATAVIVDFMAHTALLTVGTELPTFTIEEGFEDVTEYHYSSGCKVASMSMSIQPDSVITGDVMLQGQTYSGFSAVPIHGSLGDTNNNQVFDSYTGNLYFAGDLQCVITGIDFTLDNGLNRRYALMQRDACGIGEGRSNVTGTINAYFLDSTLADKFDLEEIFEARIRLEDLDENSYTFGWPQMKFTSDSRDITENEVTESFGFQALGGDTTYKNMYIKKQPNKPV